MIKHVGKNENEGTECPEEDYLHGRESAEVFGQSIHHCESESGQEDECDAFVYHMVIRQNIH